jgi:hypothetical protein
LEDNHAVEFIYDGFVFFCRPSATLHLRPTRTGFAAVTVHQKVQVTDLNTDGQMSDVMISEIISCSDDRARDKILHKFKFKFKTSSVSDRTLNIYRRHVYLAYKYLAMEILLVFLLANNTV